jgi:autotransporter family porin
LGLTIALVVGAGTAAYLETDARTVPGTKNPPPISWAPPPGGFFRLSAVGSYNQLPDDVAAAAAVHRSTWDIRPGNSSFNHTVPRNLKLRPVDPGSHAYDPRWNKVIVRRVSGQFTGTTDEILQWSAVKWGLPDEVLRTVAVMESDWDQNNTGDLVRQQQCPYPTAQPTCPLSFGLVGVNSRSFAGIFPWNRDSTAANVDMLGGWLRGCYEGWVWWLRDHGNVSLGRYHSGDLWGCVGAWFSGNWYDGQVGTRSAVDYISRARFWYDAKPWLRQNY